MMSDESRLQRQNSSRKTSGTDDNACALTVTLFDSELPNLA